jgi:hypothetical protein
MRCDIGRRFDGVASEQLSPASQQRANFVELLLQRRISHVVTLPRVRHRHNSLGVTLFDLSHFICVEPA